MVSITQLGAPSSSSSTDSDSWTYDVFLSFRGEDTRSNFTDHLYSALRQKGLLTFVDDEPRRGEELSPALLEAIQGSRVSVIVFSENYASSKRCLDVLVQILQCKESKQQLVFPVFYKVNPSDVRNHKSNFGEALATHERKFENDLDKVLGWRTALTEAGNLSGWCLLDMPESVFIDEIVEEISAQVIERNYLNVAEYPVGLDSRVQDMLEILDVGGSDIRMVGIWGIGGVGKTTIAKAVYNSIAHKFDRSCFLANVREDSEVHGGLLNLQKILLLKITGEKELMVTNVYEGITLLIEKLRYKRILLVLDDVNELEQLDKLAGAPDWFGCGSRIIITTRDKHLLTAHQVNLMYKARELDHDEACKLFSSTAFKNKRNLDDDEKLLVSPAVIYAQGLPLALVVLGSRLCDTSVHRRQDILDGYRRVLNKDIQEILKISYDGLDEILKEVFLDIACFFKGRNKFDVIRILEGCDRINPKHSIEVLEGKALLHVDASGYIWMHDLLEQMGKEIVRQESPIEPGERSRLWHHEDVYHVLTESTGTSKIEGMMLKFPSADDICLSAKCFKKLKNLKFIINFNARLGGKVDYLPNRLRFLDWPELPLKSLPSNFNMKNLVQLNMPRSRFSAPGEGLKSLQNLKSLNLGGCKFLTKIPDLSGIPYLEHLDLRGCTSLGEVHPSVGFLEKLVHLNLQGWSNFVTLPRKVNWSSLQDLNLRYCKHLESFPEIVGEMKYLRFLSLSRTAIKELPSSIRHLNDLEQLGLECCGNLTNLPCSTYALQKLREVSLSLRPKLLTFPNKVDSEVLPADSMVSDDSISQRKRHDEGCCLLEPDSEFNLALPWLCEFIAEGGSFSDTKFHVSLYQEHLDLSGSNIVSLFECISKFVNLRELNLSGCWNLVEIPQLPPNMDFLSVRDCVSLERISKLSNILKRTESQMIEEMDLTNCWRLCENLVQLAKKKNAVVNDREVDADLFSLFLSSQQSKFTITFPGSEVPKWFSYHMDFNGSHLFEYFIEILPNFKWENTGLALCIVVDQRLQSGDSSFCSFEVFIHVNEVEVSFFRTQVVDSEEFAHMWLHYVPFHEMWQLRDMCLLPPFKCRVTIFQSLYSPLCLKSCGVHLVMPPNEDACMNISCAERLTRKLSDDINKNQLNLINKTLGSWKSLTEVPNFSRVFLNSESLNLKNSKSLVELHPYVGFLDKLTMHQEIHNLKSLQDISLRNCKRKRNSLLEYCRKLIRKKSLQEYCRKLIRKKSLQDILRNYKRLKSCPEFVGNMESSTSMDLSGTAIEEASSSIESFISPSLGLQPSVSFQSVLSLKNLTSINFESCQFLTKIPDISGLPNLMDLNLNDCANLKEVHRSVGFLEKLVALSLSGCYNLVRFPRRIALKSVKHISLQGSLSLETSPEIVHKMECLTLLDLSGTAIKELPSSLRYLVRLEELILRECVNLMNLPRSIYGLQHLWCLDLQNCSKLVTFPKWSSESFPTNSNISLDLWYINLCGCKRLQEIPELPPKVEWVNAADCIQLERFAKLSNIMKHTESEMIKCISLFNCQILCGSLVRDMAEIENILLNEVTLCSLFLYCKQSEFDIVFPGTEVPKWFSHRNDLVEVINKCEFSFEIPPNFNLGNKGLAICAAAAVEKVYPKEKEVVQQSNFGKCSFTARIDINAESIFTRSFYFEEKDMELDHVWLCFVPLVKFAYRQSPPFTCGVSLEHTSQGSVHCTSYGVHLVIPQDEDEDEDEEDEDEDDEDLEDNTEN